MMRWWAAATLAFFLAVPGPSRADEGSNPGAEPSQAASPKPLGLTLEMGYATSYIFRGLNVFGDRQLDPYTMFGPSITYVVPGTSLSLGYWGGFQVNGKNLGNKLASAAGGEQDLWLNYDLSLPRSFTLCLGATAYLYPMAKASAVGVAYPVYLEPRVGASWTGPVTVSLNVMYFLGLQDTAAVRGISYLYVNPKVSKVFQFRPVVALDLSLSYGFKYFIDGNDGRDNIHDVMLRAGVPIRPAGKLYLTPGFGAAWTSFRNRSFTEGFALYGFLNVGVEL